MDDSRIDDGSVISTLFPDVHSLGLIMDGDWRDRPASKWAVRKSGTLQAKLERFRRDNVHKRPKFVSRDEISVNKLIAFANESFGYDGWCTEVLECKELTVRSEEDSESVMRHSLGMESIVRVTLKDGTYLEKRGRGTADDLPQKAMAYQKAKKQAISEALKNCIRGFGELVLDHEAKTKRGYYTRGGIFD